MVNPLNGGLTNHTARAIFSEPICLPGSMSKQRSVIVKHAPLYIASLGPAHALPTKRQAIEANTLRLFTDAQQHANDLNLVEVLRRHPNIRVPELLYYDEERHVLIISDLGELSTLLDHLKIHGTTDQFATVLGEFLAALHLSTRGVSDDLLRPFENEDASRMVQELVASLPGKLLKAEGVPDAEDLGKHVEQDIASNKQERCFGMVDLWPGSVLIGEDFVGLVDWEYAGKSCAGSELGMLTAHLHVPLLSPTLPISQSSIISSFTAEFLSAYAACSPPRTYNFIRSALLSHGRELINAVEFQGDELDGNEHRAALVQSGARCLRAAVLADSATRAAVLLEDERALLLNLI